MASRAMAQAAPLANCSIWSASRSSSGPTSSSTRRATTFPHPWATRAIPAEPIEGDLRNGIGDPSLDFGNETNWETWVDILPRSPERANRDFHPDDQRREADLPRLRGPCPGRAGHPPPAYQGP